MVFVFPFQYFRKEGFNSLSAINNFVLQPQHRYDLVTKVTHHILLRRPRTIAHSSHKSSRMTSSVDAILAGKYPAKAHARRVVDYIRKSKPDASGVLYLEGQKTRMIEDNDESALFR